MSGEILCGPEHPPTLRISEIAKMMPRANRRRKEVLRGEEKGGEGRGGEGGLGPTLLCLWAASSALRK